MTTNLMSIFAVRPTAEPNPNYPSKVPNMPSGLRRGNKEK